MVELIFDSDEYEPMDSFEPVPRGEYLVVISATEKRPAKSGRGNYLQFVYDIIDGEYKGRKLFGRLNIENDNETAQNIAKSELSAICKAVGVRRLKYSEELHDKPLVVKVVIRPANENYPASNEIKGYKSKDDMEKKPADAPAQKPAACTTSQPQTKKKPWDKSK